MLTCCRAFPFKDKASFALLSLALLLTLPGNLYMLACSYEASGRLLAVPGCSTSTVTLAMVGSFRQAQSKSTHNAPLGVRVLVASAC